jgi:hypothetical protein
MNALTLQEIRLALRRLRKDAGTTIASVAALAFAIGAAVATWSLLSGTPDNSAESEGFIRAAKEMQADESGKAFEEAMRRPARKPKPKA